VGVTTTALGTVNAAPYTIAWTPAAVGATTLTASATDSNGTTVTSTVLTVNVAAAAPTVALSAPLNGVVVTVGSNVTVSANATAGTGATVSQVQFYAGSTLIGVDTTAPYSVTWVPASAGAQNITARVVDSTGATATSAVAAVTAVSATSVAITSPANNSAATVGAATTVTASATATAGATITSVTFFATPSGGAPVQIGAPVTTAPYTVAWAPASAGSYSLTAVALVPLVLWFVVSVVSHTGADHKTAVAWLEQPHVAIPLLLLIAATFHHAQLGMQVDRLLAYHNGLRRGFGKPMVDGDALVRSLKELAPKILPFADPVWLRLEQARKDNKRVLFEGAQGTFLDIDHGTYPYVTSSNTTAGGACTGTGVPPHRMHKVVGVMKAYTTRVGEGSLPTEDAQISDLLHGMGREFGSTTGRARRCGWFDAVATRHAAMVNGIDELAVTNLDGLDTLDRIKVCTGYKVGAVKFDHMPADIEVLALCEAVYEERKGWKTDTSGARKWKDLPPAARDYLKFIADQTGAKLTIASVGPGREQTIFV